MLIGDRGSLYYAQLSTSMRRALSGRLLLLTLAIAALIAIAVPRASAQPVAVRLPGYVPVQVVTAQYMGREDPTQPVQLALTLPLRNQPELHDLLRRLYDPHDPLYGQYLTPAEFYARFSPSEADYDAVAAFAEANGMAITGTHPSRTILDVAAPAAVIEQAFSLHLERYQAPNGRIFRAPDVGPVIPAGLVGRLSAVAGLSNAAVRRNHFKLNPESFHPHAAPSSVSHYSGPAGGLGPVDIRKAYNLDGANIPDGTGQTMALYELDGYTASDITKYEDQFGLPHIPLNNVLVDGFNGAPSGTGGEVEVTLDIDLQIALAPNADQILVYEGQNGTAAQTDTYQKIADDDMAQTISTSWGLAENLIPASDRTAENASFMQMAAQGQSIYDAAGDDGADDDGTNLGVDDPASQPYMVGVGGTTLKTASDGSYRSESTWNADGTPADGAGGGGISTIWPAPDWQLGLASAASLGSITMRNVPDVSLDADPASGYDIYVAGTGGWFTVGGTSAAAPLWASFAALVNQERASVGFPTMGFANPAIYSLAQTSLYGPDFHDIADGSNNIFYPAVTGYDDATGWGTFNGGNLLFQFAAPSAPTALMAKAGNAQVDLTWTASATATGYNVKRSTVQGGPYTSVATSVAGTSYTDKTASNGTQYYYVVSAVNSAAESLDSNEVNVTTGFPAMPPTSLTAAYTNVKVTLNWTAGMDDSTFDVLRGTKSGGPYTKIASGLTGTTYVDRAVTLATTYFYVVVGENNVGASSFSNEASVTLPSNAPPDIPAGVTAVPSNTQITLSWNAAARAVTYSVQRSAVSGGPYTTVTSTATGTTFVDKGLTNGVTYYYVVSAINALGDSGASSEVSATPLPPPPAPTQLIATAGNAQVSLTWTASAGAASYQIKRGDASGGPYSTVGSVTTTSFTDTTARNGLTYYYVVTATNLGGESEQSNEVSAQPIGPPEAPPGFTVKAGAGQVTLAWNAAPSAVSYTVSRSTATDGTYAILKSGLTTTGYVDTTVTNGTTYYYKVSASNTSGQSPDAGPLTATPEALPAVPAGVAAAPGDSMVMVAWNPSANALMYQLKRSLTAGGPYTMVADSVKSNAYVDSGLTNGTTYYYVVSSVGVVANSDDSAEVNATPTPPPAAPTTLKAVPASSSEIDLSWSGDTSARFAINRSTDGVKFSQVAITPTGAFTYADTGLSAGTLYTYRLQALGVGGASGYSNTTSATTLGSGSISGSVIAKVGSASAPAPDVKITLLDSAGETLKTTTTNSFGNYSLTGLTNGSYTVQAQAQNQQSPQSQDVTLGASNNGAASGVNFTLPSLATIASGISMVSVPYSYSADGGDAAALFGLTTLADGSAPIAIYDPLSNQYLMYPNLPGKQVQPGRAYWVLESSSQSFIAAGSPVASPFTESLSPGWNMIGDPFTQALDVNSLQLTAAVAVGSTPAGTALSLQAAKSAGLIGSPFWGYNSSGRAYAQATSLQPYQGYWVYLDPSVSQNQPVKITFTNSGS